MSFMRKRRFWFFLVIVLIFLYYMPEGTLSSFFEESSKEKTRYAPPSEFLLCFALEPPIIQKRDCYRAVTVDGDEKIIRIRYQYNDGRYHNGHSKFSGDLLLSKNQEGVCAGNGESEWHGMKVSQDDRFWKIRLDGVRPCPNWTVSEGYYEVETPSSRKGRMGTFTLTPFNFTPGRR